MTVRASIVRAPATTMAATVIAAEVVLVTAGMSRRPSITAADNADPTAPRLCR
ncbi:hypothetical protein GA0074694_2150 [Micromonospora inyonensis]|uniref:Uncharacterized protein n=1 Tax=Micromonospora inyonensis TaxID=47866 RepID=A0A1C6RL63_9ACTN|nr:hypothetical protein GA0074694_2150 [Micromonospora inyonensis]